MRLKHLLAAALLLVGVSAMAQQQSMQIPPIPVDTAVRIGHLDNGLTYYIRHNNWPEHVANFYIAQRVGSIQENDEQRGLAHFLEHMAFNGSEHFPDSTLLDYTRSIGVEFGSDLNAYTSIDQTVYRVCDVPTARQTALDSCLLILKDWSNGLTLADKEIDKERGVIHQEWQLRSTPMMRIYERILPKAYPGSKYGYRLPIGLMSVVDNFKYQELRDYYKKWYRPDNQAIIVVGDVDVDHVEAEIKRLWKGVVVPKDAAKVVDEPVPDNDSAIYVVDKDKEMPYSIVMVSMKHDAVTPAEKGRMDYLLNQYAKTVIASMLNQRFDEATQKEGCPFTDASAGDYEYMISKTKDAFQLDATAKEGKELDALKAVYREAQRVRQFGFTAGEYARAKAEYLSQLESVYTNRNKIKNSQYGDQYRDNYLSGEPIPSVEDEYQIMNMLVGGNNINVDMINMAAKQLISDNDTNLVVAIFGQDKAGHVLPTEAQMAEAVKAVRAEKLEPYVDNTKTGPIVDEATLPKAGTIVSEKENTKLGYKELQLSNGARVILKKTNFKDNEIKFQAVARGGSAKFGAADYDNLKLFNGVMAASGRGAFSNNDLTKALAGKQASTEIGLGNFYTFINGTSVPKDVETLMQLVYLDFTAVKADTASYKSTMNSLRLMLKNKDLSPESAFSDSLQTTIHGHALRFAPMSVKTLDGVSYERELQIWADRFAQPGRFTYYFVGNFDEATLRPLIEKYIASLPAGKEESFAKIGYYADGENINKFTRKMETTPKAMAFDFWHAPASLTLDNSVVADAAGQLLSMVYLKSIREDASAAYSVGSYAGVSRVGNDAKAMLQTVCPMDPNKVATAVKLIATGLTDNTKTVDAGSVQKIKDTMLKKADEDAKSNAHWMDILQEYIETGVDLQTGYKAAVAAITPAKIATFLRNLVAAGNHSVVVMTPAK